MSGLNVMNTSLRPKVALPLFAPTQQQFMEDVLDGLSRPQKSLPSKYLYDDNGSRLFDAICDLPEYYPTRTELSIMREHAAEMAECIGPNALLVELGSGSGIKTRMLLDALESPAGYVPVDICRHSLIRAAEVMRSRYSALRVLPVCADFLTTFELPAVAHKPRRTVIYFPGSTIGNFEPFTACRLLRHIHRLAGPRGLLLIGLDLQKDPRVLERAYNDRDGVTAAFNLNILNHINRELGADFQLDRFEHVAAYNAALDRIEMHLRSCEVQSVRLANRQFNFESGETIHTENSYKYKPSAFAEMAAKAGFTDDQQWLDGRGWFAVWSLLVA